jgi:hypothetical protein
MMVAGRVGYGNGFIDVVGSKKIIPTTAITMIVATKNSTVNTSQKENLIPAPPYISQYIQVCL